MSQSISSQILRKLLGLLVAAGLLVSGSMACIGGGSVGGGGANPIGGPNIGSAPPPPGGIGDQAAAAPSMPDIAVGPVPDIVLDPNALKGPQYSWRVFGTALTLCRATETEPINPPALHQGPSTRSRLLNLFEGQAHAAGNEVDVEATALHATTRTVHRLKVGIKAQIQFNVDGGPFYDWKPGDFEGTHVIRAMDPHHNVVDTQIKEAGNLELNFLLRLGGEPSSDTFLQAMQDLHFYRTPSNFPTTNLDVQKKCDPSTLGETSCKAFFPAFLRDIKEMVPAQPNYGASSDFAGLPECS